MSPSTPTCTVAVAASIVLGSRVFVPARLYEQAKIVAIAERLGKTPGQVILRYPIQRGLITIPKSTNAGRIAQNIDLFDFELTDEDMATLASFENARGRACAFSNMKDHPLYPF